MPRALCVWARDWGGDPGPESAGEQLHESHWLRSRCRVGRRRWIPGGGCGKVVGMKGLSESERLGEERAPVAVRQEAGKGLE